MNFISEERVEQAVHWLPKHAHVASKAKAERGYMEAFTKHLIAKIKKEYPSLSDAKAETEAYADNRYLEHITAVKIAVENDCLAQYQKEAVLAELDAWRTLHATERALKL